MTGTHLLQHGLGVDSPLVWISAGRGESSCSGLANQFKTEEQTDEQRYAETHVHARARVRMFLLTNALPLYASLYALLTISLCVCANLNPKP